MGFADLLGAADRVALQHLGDAVTYTPESGEPVEAQGIFDATYVKVDAGQAGVSSSGPAVFFKLADLPSDPEDEEATVTVSGTAYRVKEVQKDGQGGVVLLLKEA